MSQHIYSQVGDQIRQFYPGALVCSMHDSRATGRGYFNP